MPIKVVCEICHQAFKVKPSRMKRGNVRFCSRECHEQDYKKITYKKRTDGYIQITGNGLNILEHRYVMTQYLGREIHKWEHVHHKNGDRSDNNLDNLELLTIREHGKLHSRERDLSTWTDCICKQCKTTFVRRSKEVERHPETFCSRKCYLDNRRDN